MLNDNAKKWVEALRSGRFQQTKRVLRDDNGYCCLGVACEVAREQGMELQVSELKSIDSLDRKAIHYNGQPTTLPRVVKEWLGLTYENGDYISAGQPFLDCLASRNDMGATFNQIADIIESEPKGLFRE